MSDFHNFADSFFSPAMWGPGAEFLPYVIATLYVIVSIALIVLVSRFIGEMPGFAVFLIVVVIAVIASSVATRGVDREIAQKNIAMKYDTSEMRFEKFGGDGDGALTGNTAHTITSAVYPDRAANIYREIYFVFPKGSNEPFLLRKEMSDEEFQNLEKAILKDE
jgi:hypothetical protein